jgi:hypothetical protein
MKMYHSKISKIFKIMLHVFAAKILGYSLPVRPHHTVAALL